MRNVLINHAMPLNGFAIEYAYFKGEISDEEYKNAWYTFMRQHLKFDLRACTCDTCMENRLRLFGRKPGSDQYPCGQYRCYARCI